MSPEIAARARRNLALRLSLAVTLGMTIEVLRDAALPPLAPVLALQLLAASPRPPGLRLIVALVGTAAASGGIAYLVSSVATGYAGLYTIGTALLYIWGFFLAIHPKFGSLGALVLTISIVVSALSASSTGAAAVILLELLKSFVTAFAIIYVAHAVFPDPVGAAGARKAPPGPGLPALTRAILATIVILPLHLYLTSDGVAAMVVLMTAATMLRQPGLAESTRYSVTFALGNFAGASLAALSFLVMSTHDDTVLLVAVLWASSLVLASQIARGPRLGAVFVPGFVAYTMLFGLTLSSLPLADDVAIVARVLSIVGAALYVLGMASLLIPFLKRHLARTNARAS